MPQQTIVVRNEDVSEEVTAEFQSYLSAVAPEGSLVDVVLGPPQWIYTREWSTSELAEQFVSFVETRSEPPVSVQIINV